MRFRSYLPAVLVLGFFFPAASAQETEYNWTNATGSSNWFHSGNWGINDGTTPGSNGVANIISTPAGNVQFDGSATVRTLNIGVGAGLNLTAGSLTFSDRTGSAPFAMQNSGEINLYGDDATMQLKDEMHNFSSKVINLFDGAILSASDGNALVNTSNLNTGNGLINMSGGMITGVGGAIITLDKQTISGSGQFGEGDVGFVFGADTIVQGSFSFDTSGITNTGILRGGLTFTNQAINNTGGLIEAPTGAAVQFANGFNVTGGTLRAVGTGTFDMMGTGSLANLTLDGTSVLIDAGRDLSIDGTITNTGDISIINPGNANTDLRIDGLTSLDGGGTITLGGVSSTLSRITDPSGANGVLTNVDNTIQGKGLVGTNSVRIINLAGATIDANDSTGSLTLQPVATSSFVNRGLLTASNGGSLIFGGGEYDNLGGVVDLQDGSTVTLGANARITGGTVRSLGTGLFRSTSSATLNDLTVQGNLSVQFGDEVRLEGTIHNEGDISVINPGNANTDLRIDAATTLAGGGTITMGGVSSTLSRITDPSGTDAVLTNVDNTIQGKGLLGTDTVQIINEVGGTISGNDSTGTLSLGVSPTTPSINRGLITSSGDGHLIFTAGDIDNSAGLVEPQSDGTVTVGGTATVTGGLFHAADGGTIKFAGSGSIVNGLLQSTGTGSYKADSGAGFLVDSTNQSSITVSSGADLNLVGTITNTGDISIINPGNANTDLRIDGLTSLDGGGTITLGGVSSTLSRITDPSGANGVLTNVDNTIQGKGLVGTNSVRIINLAGATIDANDSTGSLTLQPVATSSFVNRGLLTASNGGSLIFGGGEYDNLGGVVDLQDGSTVTLGANARITGGTVRSLGTGLFRSTSSATLNDLTVQGNLSVQFGDEVRLEGTIHNEGDISVINPGNANTDLRIDAATTLAGGGTITMGGVSSTLSRITDPSGTDAVLTNVDNTIQGKGLLGTDTVQIINEVGGTISGNDSTGTLSLGVSPTTPSINRGLITSSGDGHLIFTAGDIDNSAGLVEPQSDGTVTVGGTATVTGGLFHAADGGTIKFAGSGSIVNGLLQSTGTGSYKADSGAGFLVDSTNQSSITVSSGADLNLVGTITNNGDISVINPGNSTTDLRIDAATTLAGGGTITMGGVTSTLSRITDPSGADGVLTNVDNTIQGKGYVGTNSVQIINLTGGTIDANISGTLTVDSAGDTLNNAGTLTASNGGSLSVVGILNNDGIVRAQMGSSIQIGTLINNVSGRLIGDGSINSSNPITSSGTIAPGNSPGTLSLNQSLTTAASSHLEIELESLASFDLLAASGDVTLDGTLSLELLGGYMPSSGDVFDIVTSNSLSGMFSNIAGNDTLFTLDKSGVFTVSYTATTVRLSNFATVPDCDFNNSGTCNGTDIDQLVADIAAGLNSSNFDMNGDGNVDGEDLTEWLTQAGEANLPSMNSYLLGDANLDGAVDGQDFLAWNDSKFTATAAWTSGDFNADGFVDGSDFLLWNTFKFQTADGLQAVPEPASCGLLLLGLLASLWSTRRNS